MKNGRAFLCFPGPHFGGVYNDGVSKGTPILSVSADITVAPFSQRRSLRQMLRGEILKAKKGQRVDVKMIFLVFLTGPIRRLIVEDRIRLIVEERIKGQNLGLCGSR